MPARDSLMVDAPYAPIERPAPEIPESPVPLHPAAPSGEPQPFEDAQAPESIRERTLFDRLAGLRIEPILGRLRAAAPAAAPSPAEPAEDMPAHAAQQPVEPAEEGIDENPFTPDAFEAEQPTQAVSAPGVKIIPRRSAVAQGKRAAEQILGMI